MHPSRRQTGAAAVEFALALVVLLPLLAGLAGLGSAFYAEMALVNGIRAGGQYAQLNRCTSSGCGVSSVVLSDVQHDLPSFVAADVSVAYAQICMDGSTPSNGSCSSADPTPWNEVGITASYTFPVLLAGLIPGMPSTLRMSQSANYRVN